MINLARALDDERLIEKIEQLEEENRKLRESLAKEGIRMDMMNHYNEIKEENKKLKEKIETLELRLDNKEKLNEEYRKQLNGYKM